ncbi:660_t:CDS:2 [Cetraspora pellucida]|uniref:660_t:CDS:1 n=1 Tax=Cetraspora pellucida TaxID=1433469 RepID=A0ACA9KRS9_9GLOM|nr:660_t:CDS:2 [Cetraspora pellucida]
MLILKAMLDNQNLRHPDPYLSTQPIFGPPFTHIQQPYRSYCVGSNTPLDDPGYYLDCLHELVIIYRRDIACAADHCTSALLSYFYFTPAMLTKQENTKWWQFDKPLIHHSPCEFSFSLEMFQLLYVLNGSIVGLIGNILDVDENLEIVDESETSHEKGISIQPPRYFPSPDYPPPDPSEYTFLRLYIIRSIDPVAHTFHILTPLSYVELQKTRLIVKRSLDLPTCFMLDHSNNISTGVCGVPCRGREYLI